MYRDNGIDRSYDDAIPVKRSKRSERVRQESRRETSKSRGSVDFTLNRKTEPAKTEPKLTVAVRDNPVKKPVPVSAPARQIAAEESPAKETAPVKRPTKVGPPTQEMPTRVKSSVATPTHNHSDEEFFAILTDGNIKKTETDDIILPDIPADEAERRSAPTVDMDMRTYDEEAEPDEDEPSRGGLTVGKVIRRSLLSVFTALILAVATVFAACYTVAIGPSETVRNILVLSAMQASATKWVPGLFLDDAVVDQILEDSKKVNKDVISVEDYQNQQKEENAEDKWASAIDGMIYETVSGPTFKGYVLLVKDPARVSVGIATDEFSNDTEGLRIFEMAKKYGAIAAINGGEYPDAGGMGVGGRPIGLTYSEGECVWNDNLRRSFMGFDKDNRLVVREGLTKAQADGLGIRDGVCFQTGKTLITNEDGNVTMYYADNDTGTAQRTAIGQTADGTVILLVTDGRTASSLGATHNDVINVMVSYGAISAGMLDGGSSSLMYYKDYYDKYGIDKSGLDEYQQMGLINKYKAFTTPRRLPTCFIVAPE